MERGGIKGLERMKVKENESEREINWICFMPGT